MKNSMFALAAMAGTVMMLVAGCSSTSIDTNRFGSQIVLKMDVVEFVPQIAVGEKYISGSSECTVYCGFIRIGDTAKQASGVSFSNGGSIWGGSDAYQRAAIYDACSRNKADILLAPQYTTTVDGNFFKKTVSCTVKGFPGYIKSVKLASPESAKAKLETKDEEKK